jgi:hypothetical protein
MMEVVVRRLAALVAPAELMALAALTPPAGVPPADHRVTVA